MRRLVRLEVEPIAWGATLAVIAALFAVDLASASSRGWDYGAEYFAGYIVEKSLSVSGRACCMVFGPLPVATATQLFRTVTRTLRWRTT